MLNSETDIIKNSSNKGIRNVFYNYLGRFGSQAIGILATVYMIRELPLQVYGDYNILFSIYAFIGLFTSFGLGNVIQRFIPEYTNQNNLRIFT